MRVVPIPQETEAIAILLLKIIGFTLLALVSLLLLSLCLLLFVPVRYAVYGNIQSGVEARASWLLRLVRLKYNRSKAGEDLRVYVFFFRVPVDIGAQEEAGEAKDAETPEPPDKDFDKPPPTDNAVTQTPAFNLPKTEDVKRHTPKIKSLHPVEAVKNRIDGIREGINAAREKISYYKNYPDRDEIISATLELLKKLWRAVLPKRFLFDGDLGLDSPHHTAYLFAVLGSLNIYHRGLEPNFDEPSLNVGVDIRGNLNLWSVLWPLFRYAIKRPIWPVTKKILFRKGDADE